MIARRWVRAVALALVAVGLVGGMRRSRWLRDVARPALTSEACPECTVSAVDLHVHTRFSDGFLSPMEVVLAADRQQLDAIAITEHNMLFPARMAAWFSDWIGGPIVLLGQEVTTSKYHLIAVGLAHRVTPRADLHAVIEEIHRQGGVAIAAHPTARYWPAFDAVRDQLDAAEVVHPAAYSGSDIFRWQDMVTFFEREGARPLSAVGSSDFHFMNTLGVVHTEVLLPPGGTTRVERARQLIVALQHGDTRVMAPDGQRFGRWAPGESEPPPSALPRYAAIDGVDWVARACGWLGVLLWLVWRPARKK